jgi:hypothetical protein
MQAAICIVFEGMRNTNNTWNQHSLCRRVSTDHESHTAVRRTAAGGGAVVLLLPLLCTKPLEQGFWMVY